MYSFSLSRLTDYLVPLTSKTSINFRGSLGLKPASSRAFSKSYLVIRPLYVILNTFAIERFLCLIKLMSSMISKGVPRLA